ncbi:hypothetical protein PR048_013595 [Dryococelus australis]|uniref:Uncharacterized protein n=1 Tax=Dryococelus australis TaxID=614101 RepID=A0ABQ9HTF6_9NEOP|nr:hypothetical protein PR048_013595 [Dryococelus australis]
MSDSTAVHAWQSPALCTVIPAQHLELWNMVQLDSRIYRALSFQRCSILTSITLIGCQDLDVKSCPNLFTSLHIEYGAAPECKDGKWEISEKICPPEASSGMIPTCKNLGGNPAENQIQFAMMEGDLLAGRGPISVKCGPGSLTAGYKVETLLGYLTGGEGVTSCQLFTFAITLLHRSAQLWCWTSGLVLVSGGVGAAPGTAVAGISGAGAGWASAASFTVPWAG